MHKDCDVNRLRSESKVIDFKTMPDTDLFGMCIAGDEKAWEYLYNYILRICEWWHLNSPDDMTDKVVLELLEGRLGTIRKKDRLRHFVKLLTQSRIKDYLKSAQSREVPIYRRAEEDGEDEFDLRAGCHEPTQMENLNCMEVMAIVDQAVEKLGSMCRRVVREYLNFKLGFYEDYQELSRVLDMSVPNISSRVNRCMKTLIGFKEIQLLKILIMPD